MTTITRWFDQLYPHIWPQLQPSPPPPPLASLVADASARHQRRAAAK